jgi:hypothetical protein
VGAPSINVSTSGNVVTLNWAAVAGAVGYRIQVGRSPGATEFTRDVGAHERSFSVAVPLTGTFYVRVLAGNSCMALTSSNEASFTIGSQTPGPTPPPTGGGFRTPDPPAGQRLPLPGYGEAVVNAVAAAYGGDLFNSCREHGGNNTFLYRVVQALRTQDTRWGLNWKRGNRGDMSQDVVTYHWGAGADEDSTQVYIIDMIGGHCGNRPYPTWNDVTQATANAGTIGRWTLTPYVQSGLAADPRR